MAETRIAEASGRGAPISGADPQGTAARSPGPRSTVVRPAAATPRDPIAHAMRAVHRAVSDLRRGTPVVIEGPDEALIVAAAETVGARGLAELAALAPAPPVLLLAPSRAAAVLARPVPYGSAAEATPTAVRLPPALLAEGPLRALADPVLAPTPEGAALAALPSESLSPAALALAKVGRLLPAVVAARVGPGAPRGDLLSVAAADILSYPLAAATSLTRVSEAAVPLEDAADARIVAFRAADGGIEHLAILVGRPESAAPDAPAPLCRAHSECFTGDLLGSLRCDCGPQLRGAIARMAADGGGVLLYLAQEGRGIGLANKLRAYALQDAGLDTLDANRALGYGADERSFLVAATMLEALGIPRVRLLTNNPDKVAGLAACGITVEGRVSHLFAGNGVNDGYLDTKKRRFGHMMP